MFTGLVQAVGCVAQTRRIRAAKGRSGWGAQGGLRLVIDPGDWLAAPAGSLPALGDSISISGVCLTIAEPVDPRRRLLAFDAIPETLSKTTLGGLKRGDAVNLEHAATMSTLLGGHLVQGHVDGVGTVERVMKKGGDWRVLVKVKKGSDGKARGDRREGFDLMSCIVPKGSITIDGVSLTVVDTWSDSRGGQGEGFSVALIPTTLAKTTLKSLKAGDAVNLEVDVIGKTVVSWMQRYLAASPPVAVKPKRGRT